MEFLDTLVLVLLPKSKNQISTCKKVVVLDTSSLVLSKIMKVLNLKSEVLNLKSEVLLQKLKVILLKLKVLIKVFNRKQNNKMDSITTKVANP